MPPKKKSHSNFKKIKVKSILRGEETKYIKKTKAKTKPKKKKVEKAQFKSAGAASYNRKKK